jgi:hypothetical protein
LTEREYVEIDILKKPIELTTMNQPFRSNEHLEEHFVLIYAPTRKRKRYPQNCVYIQASEKDAIDGADTCKNLYPAKVRGPFISSEGFYLFYLVKWLIKC